MGVSYVSQLLQLSSQYSDQKLGFEPSLQQNNQQINWPSPDIDIL